MFKIVVFYALAVGVLAAEIEVVKNEHVVNPDGSFKTEWDLSNGVETAVEGVLKNLGDESAVVQTGSQKWVSPEGEEIKIDFVADENGYQPVGDHIPTPPPIPDAIQRSLEYIEKHPPQA